MTARAAQAEARQRQLLRALFDAALDAARIDGKLAGFLPSPPRGRTVVVGGGKAAAAMAAAMRMRSTHWGVWSVCTNIDLYDMLDP